MCINVTKYNDWRLHALCPDTPSQRVQFILGTEDDDLEHVPHDLFTELDELSFRDGSATEWKETARSENNRMSEQHDCNHKPNIQYNHSEETLM